MDPVETNELCLECGLCCNGVIFADVQLQPADDEQQLRSLGFSLVVSSAAGSKTPGSRPKSKPAKLKFLQPCSAFDGCRCRIYADRPGHCRSFECLTLKQLHSGKLERKAASRVVAEARRRVDEVRQLLRELGDDDEQVSLTRRFRRVQRRLERNVCNKQTAEQFSRLSLAVHDLNLLLRDAFYPGG